MMGPLYIFELERRGENGALDYRMSRFWRYYI